MKPTNRLTTLVEPAGPEMHGKISRRIPAVEKMLIRVSSDLDSRGNYGIQWVVATDKRVLLIPPFGYEDVLEILLKDVSAFRTEVLVGGCRLEIEREGAPTVVVPYTNSLAVKFSEVTRGLEQLRKGEPFEINPKLTQLRCEKCGRLLPEKDGICPACVRKWQTMRRIVSYMKPYKKRAIIVTVIAIVSALVQLIPPLITRRIVDDVLMVEPESVYALDERFPLLGLLVVALVGAQVLAWAAEFVIRWLGTWMSVQVTGDVRVLLYRKLEIMSLQYYDKRRIGALISRVVRDTQVLQSWLVEDLPYLIITGLIMIGVIAFMFAMSWQLALFILIPLPLLLSWIVLFEPRLHRILHKYSAAWSTLGDRLTECFNGIRVVKAFGQEPREIDAFERPNLDLARISRKKNLNWRLMQATKRLVLGIAMVIFWFAGCFKVLDGALTIGTLLAMYGYMGQAYAPIGWILNMFARMTEAFAGAERIFEVIDARPEPYTDPKALPLSRMGGRVVFKDVTFGYDKSKPVLEEINLVAEPGEVIGLVGKSGAGKTTTVNLVSRFYDVDQGCIEIDGIDIRKIRLRDLRRQIGIVPQEPVLFSGSIAQNISYGRPGATFEEIVAAAKSASAHTFIIGRPDGYDTNVGERGANLSVGEKQRIAIARSILHDPAVLILDEATSSLDVETEKQIQESILRLVKGRTTFAIAHRLSTLRHADRLIILESGRIVEMGSHNELMRREGIFYELVHMQQALSEVIALKG